VHDAAAANVGVAEPQGLVPPFKFNANGVPVAWSREIDETLTGAVPELEFAMVTSNGFGVLPAVTVPKSKVAGKTSNDPAGGGGVGTGAGVGLGLGALPPELHPTTVKAAAAKSKGRNDERSFMMELIP
jgi:hypothetical protein